MIGKIISHYKILEKLGEGGMGVVYKAEDTKLKRLVALKFLPPELTRDPDAKTRFIHEAQSASALQDSNICTIHEIDETEDGQMFICMDFYHGETLKQKIDRGPLKIGDAIHIASQIASGLATAHEAQMIHRDIKSANIIITDKGEVKIVDFGLAKLRGQTRITMEGTTVGTVAYMSPEQVKGEDVNHRSDIWSLGVVLYEMLTGQLSFKGDYEQAIMYAIVNEDPQPLTALRTGVPMELERIVNKTMAKNPDKRYQHADELLVDLQQVLAALSTTGKTYVTKVEIKKEESYLRKYFLPVAVIIILILAFILLQPFLVKDTVAVQPKPVVVISFKNLTGDKTYDYLQEAIPNLLITSLEQSKYFRVISWERMYDLLKQLGKPDLTVIDQETGFEICRLEGVEAIILGSYIKAGDIFATDVKVLDVQSKQLIKSASSKGEGVGSILQNQIDDLSREISQSVGISENIVKSTQLRISDVTTASMEAYHNFLRGQDAYDNFYYEDARKYLERAVQLDSTFALAYLYLAWADDELYEDENRDTNYEKAKINASRAGEKDRMYIEAYYARQIEKNPDKRLLILQTMADKYPKEKRIYYDLGLYYHGQKDYRKAIDAHNRALQLDPNYGPALNDLAYVYGDMGEFEKSDEYLKKYTNALPGDANPFDSFGELYLRTGRFDKAINKYKEAIEVKPDFGSEWRIAWIFAIQEDYRSAIEWVNRFIPKSEGTSIRGNWWKGLFCYLSGKPAEALQLYESCLENSRKMKSKGGETFTEFLKAWILLDQVEIKQGYEHNTNVYESRIMDSPQYKANHEADLSFYRGLTYIIQSKIDSARLELNNIHQLFSKLTPLAKERHQYNQDYLYAQILLAADSLEAAEQINKLMKPLETPFTFNINWLMFNFPLSKDGLAQAYQRHGKLDQAIEEYNKLIDQDPKKYGLRLINPKYHYRLAKLYEQKGQTKEAIQQYAKFLNIWSQAEQNLPEFIDATNRLKELNH